VSDPKEDEPVERRIERFRALVADRIATAGSFEEAASAFAAEFYTTFGDFTILARVFAIVPYRRLDALERARLGPFDDDVPVLTLFGTRGVEPTWNDRRQSRGHRAIPLVSKAFVEEAPMIAMLLAEIGGTAQVDDDRGDWQFVKRVADTDGLFFVGDARTTTDRYGRPVIPAVDFVERYRIRTVFGFGRHADDGSLVVVVVFCRKPLLRAFALPFVELIDLLRYGNAGVTGGSLFSSGSADSGTG